MTTEAQLWQSLKPKFERAGALAVRIENAAAISLPDVALITPRRTVWVELKIRRGNYVHLPKFQFAFAAQLANKANRALFWLIAGHEDLIPRCWCYRDLIDCVEEDGEDRVKINLPSEKRKHLTNVLETIRKGK